MASASTRILIDAGLSRRELISRLEAIGEKPEALDAVLISHEHSDHVCGLLPLARKFNLPVYVSRLTAPAIPWDDASWGDRPPRIEQFGAGESFTIGDLRIQSFTIPHDAIDPVGFTVESGGSRAGVVTDLGYIPESVKFHLRDTDLLLLESNHDLEMLRVGPYPWSVKQRVMGRNGHLSNHVVSDFILNAMDECVKTLILGHLSEHNNHPAIVHTSAARAMSRRALFNSLVVAEPRIQNQVFQV